MVVAEPRTRKLNGTTQGGPYLERAVRDYVRAYASLHGRRKAAENLGVSRHTLWRFLERGHPGRAVPAAVLQTVLQTFEWVVALLSPQGRVSSSPVMGTHPDWQRCRRIISGIAGNLTRAESQRSSCGGCPKAKRCNASDHRGGATRPACCGSGGTRERLGTRPNPGNTAFSGGHTRGGLRSIRRSAIRSGLPAIP